MSPTTQTVYSFLINRDDLPEALVGREALTYLIMDAFPKSEKFGMKPELEWNDDVSITMTWDRRLTIANVKKRLHHLPFMGSPIYKPERTEEEAAIYAALGELQKKSKKIAKRKAKIDKAASV